MATKIEWCKETWNPIQDKRKGKSGRGYHCTKCSPGCLHCWAETMNVRFGNGFPFDDTPVEFEIVEKQFRKPESWHKPRTIFVQSMGDLFHDAVPYEIIDHVMRMAINAPQHTYLILTKRIKRALHYFTRGAYRLTDRKGVTMCGGFDEKGLMAIPDNVQVGTSVCTQDETWKIDKLLQIPAAVRFVSLEPLLEETNLRGKWINPYQERFYDTPKYDVHTGKTRFIDKPRPRVSWVIVGAETGPGARPMDLDWARSVRDQCQSANVPFFFKKDSDGNNTLDGQTWEQFPKE